MSGALSVALLVAMAAGHTPIPVRRLRPMTSTPKPMASGNFTLTVTPATINFVTSNNPTATPVVAGSAPASVTWNALSIFDNNNWTLTVQSASPNFANCPSVPISAVTVTCSSATLGGVGGSATCSGSFPLSTTPQTVAGGVVGTLYSYNYSVTINFTLADSWKYIAETNPQCSLSLNYVANVP